MTNNINYNRYLEEIYQNKLKKIYQSIYSIKNPISLSMLITY